MTGGMSFGRRRSDVTLLGVALAACVALLMALLPADVQAATTRHNVYAWLDNTCVGGEAPKGARLRVTWKSASGTLKKSGRVKASSKGRWSLCTSSKRVAQGDRIMAKLGTRKLTAVVPRIDVSVDRESNVVSGLTKANQRLIIQVCWWREQYRDTYCDFREVQADGAGRFSADMDTVIAWGDLLGGDSVEVFTVGSRQPHTFGRLQRVPYVEVLLGDDTLSGGYEPGGSLTVELQDSGQNEKASWTGIANRRAKAWSGVYKGNVHVSGLYSGRFEPSGPVAEVDDFVASPALPPTPGLPVRDIDVSAVAASDVVSGTCATKSRYQLRATTNGVTKTLPYRMTAQDGSFTQDLTGKHDVRTGTVVTATCFFWTGDRVSVRSTVG